MKHLIRERTLRRLENPDTYGLTYKISKYRPDDAIIDSEWTSYSDIGKVFNGKRLTIEEYICSEDNYINIARSIAQLSDISYFTVAYLEKNISSISEDSLTSEMSNMLQSIAEGKRLNISQSTLFLRLALRELIWGVLVNESKHTMIYVGYDFYLNVQTALSSSQLASLVNEQTMFVMPINDQFI